MQIQANGINLEVRIDGPADGAPLLLIMGLGMQLVAWPDGFVAALVERGFRVIRFDNRDAGLSRRFDAAGPPRLAWQALRYQLRLPVRAPYRLEDCADDAVGLLAALGIGRAHVCGASMGGMIAQLLALDHPDRVSSLTLIMSASGERSLPGPSRAARAVLMSRPRRPSDPASIVDHLVRLFRVIGSPAYPEPEDGLRARLSRAVARAWYPAGTMRQLLAVMAAAPRGARLATLAVPTAVVHGSADPLLPPACGRDLAARIPAAELVELPGMGHDLPDALWPPIADAVRRTAARARSPEQCQG